MGQMKKYSQFLKELPSKTVVFAFGRFNPPTTGHELLVKAVKKLAATNKADHAIYASKTQDAKKNPLTVEKKVHYLNLMFPNTHFVAANAQERTFIEAVKSLNKTYNKLIMVAGSDRVPEYEKILTKYNGKDFNYDSIQVISAGERDPDADDATGMSASKMRSVAAKGDYVQFKQGLPSTMREIDGRRLMNDVRMGMGLESIKEQINLVKDDLREQYFRGEIFNIGDIVECNGQSYEIVKRGSNHLLLKEESGKLVSKWIQDVSTTQELHLEESMIPEELTDKTLKASDKIKVARIIATMLGTENAEASANAEMLVNTALRKVRTKALNPEALKILDKMLALATEVGIQYDATLKPSKLKEGVIQPNGTDQIPVTTDSPVVNTKSKFNIAKDRMSLKDFTKLKAMNKEETEIDTMPITCSSCKDKKCSCEDTPGSVKAMEPTFDPFFNEESEEVKTPVVDMSNYEGDYDHNMEGEEISDEDLDKMAEEVNDIDDVMDVYEDDELAIVDDESGEEIPDGEEEKQLGEQALMEVLSRMERMRAKMRIKRSQAKRERSTKIALRTYSGTEKINKRARRLAIKLMKTRLLRGRDPAKVSVGEKERIERTIEKRKNVVGRLAMRLAPRVRKIEKARLSHTKFTQGSVAAPSF